MFLEWKLGGECTGAGRACLGAELERRRVRLCLELRLTAPLHLAVHLLPIYHSTFPHHLFPTTLFFNSIRKPLEEI